MKRRTMVIVAGLLVVAGGAAAIAAVGDRRGGHGHGPRGMDRMMMGEMGFGGPGRMGEWLKRLDANNDGEITIEEVLAVRQPMFARLDTNGDGVIDAQEMEAETQKNVDYWGKVAMHRLDSDRDGKITREEFSRGGIAQFGMRGDRREARDEFWRGDRRDGGEGRRHGWMRERMAGRAFDRFDLNSDGVLDAYEVETAVKQRVTRRINGFVRRFDQDGDGRITRDEFDRPARERFAARDINSDGKITEEDLPPAMRGRGILR